MNLSEDEIKREILSFETGKMDEILSDLAALIIQFKDLRDKKIIEEKILEELSQFTNTCKRPLLTAG